MGAAPFLFISLIIALHLVCSVLDGVQEERVLGGPSPVGPGCWGGGVAVCVAFVVSNLARNEKRSPFCLVSAMI